MSELKAYNVVATADVNPEVVDILGCTEWSAYNKEEVDKVIEDKDAEIAQLQAILEERNKQIRELKYQLAVATGDCHALAGKFEG